MIKLLEYDEEKALAKAKEICELQINNEYNSGDDEKLAILCSLYFDIAISLNLRKEFNSTIEDIFEVFKIIIFGYFGKGSQSVKAYLDIQPIIEKIQQPEQWNKRLLYGIIKAISLLVIKENHNDIKDVINIINDLRKEQLKYESEYLKENSSYRSAELISLYYLAKTVEILAKYIIEYVPNEPEKQIKHYTEIALEFADLSQNLTLFLLLKYFKRLADQLLKDILNKYQNIPNGV